MATDQLPAPDDAEIIRQAHAAIEGIGSASTNVILAIWRTAIAADRARAVPGELERNVQPSINLSVQMPKIELQDPELDATDPHTRLLLLAEYWKREAMRHKDHADTQREELLRTWHVLHTFGTHPGRTDDRLANCVRNALMARPPAPERLRKPADLSGQAATAAGERDLFEAFFRDSRRGKGQAALAKLLERMPGGDYVRDHTQRHWWTWQQARASLSTPASGEGWKLMPEEPADEMIRAMLAAEWPGLYGKSLREPFDGPTMTKITDQRIATAKKQYAAAYAAAPTSHTEPAAAIGGEA